MGYLLHATGISIYLSNDRQDTAVMFAGSFIACFFWVSLHAIVVKKLLLLAHYTNAGWGASHMAMVQDH